MPIQSLKYCLVRIFGDQERTVGAGFLVGKAHILTCAHVVTSALGIPANTLQRPEQLLILDFPLLPVERKFQASVFLWLPEADNKLGDIAVLELKTPPPTWSIPARLVDGRWEQRFNTIGFPSADPAGAYALGQILDVDSTGLVQLTGGRETATFIEQGFSGTPVWLVDDEAAAGMVVATHRQTDRKVAYMIPSSALRQAWTPVIAPEVEPLSAIPYGGFPQAGTPVVSPPIADAPPVPGVAASYIAFISYSHKDQAIMTRLRTDLEGQGLKVWVDVTGLVLGTRNWEIAIRDAIRESSYVVYLASTDSGRSNYTRDEVAIAAMYRRPVLALWVAGQDNQWMDCVPLGWGALQYSDMRGEAYAKGLETLLAVLRGQRVPASVTAELLPPPPPSQPRNPYKGLRAFTESDEDVKDFFGREALIDSLLTRLTSSSDSMNLLAILGPSGSGKSSLVMAGLLPRLKKGGLSGSNEWNYVSPIRLSSNPLETLTGALHSAGGGDLDSVREALENPDSQGLATVAKKLAPLQGKRVVLFIDQFEELFAQTVKEATRVQFIELLTAAATQAKESLSVILTLRADFYDKPMEYPEFGALLQTHGVPILPMSVADLRESIEGPAALDEVQITFDEGLVVELVFEVRDQIGALPLLQFALEELFNHRDKTTNQITWRAYDGIGGVRGALASHADETYHKLIQGANTPDLSASYERLTRELFRRLVALGATEQDTVRVRIDEDQLIFSDGKKTELMENVLETFVAARLLTKDRQNDRNTVEISHEALIREWKLLANWLRASRADSQFQKKLSADAAAWKSDPADTDLLYKRKLLENALDWKADNSPSTDELKFIEDSQRHVARLRRRQRLALGAVLFSVIGSLVFALIVVNREWLRSKDLIGSSAAIRFVGQAVGLSGSSTQSPELAALFSITALNIDYSESAAQSLLMAFPRLRTRRVFVGGSGGVTSVAFISNDEALTGDSAGFLRRWSVNGNNQPETQQVCRSKEVNHLDVSGDTVLILCADNSLQTWDVKTNALQLLSGISPTIGNGITTAAFLPGGKLIHTLSGNRIQTWDVSTGQLQGKDILLSITPDPSLRAAFSPEGSQVLTTSITNVQCLGDATLWKIDSDSAEETAVLPCQEEPLLGAAFSSDGLQVLITKASASDGTPSLATLWKMTTPPSPVFIFSDQVKEALSGAISPDGRWVLTGSDDGTARLYSTQEEPFTFNRHKGEISDIAISPNGKWVVSVGGNAWLWSVDDPEIAWQLGTANNFHSVAFSPDGSSFVLGDEIGNLQQWDTATRKQFGSAFGPGDGTAITTVLFSPLDSTQFLVRTSKKGGTVYWIDHRQSSITPVPLMAEGLSEGVLNIAISRDGSRIFTAHENGKLGVWAYDGSSRPHLVDQFSDALPDVYNVAVSPDGQLVAAVSSSGAVRVWDVGHHKLVPKISEIRLTNGAFVVTFSPDGESLVIASDDAIQIRDWRSGAIKRTIPGNRISWLILSHDGRVIISGEQDGTVRINYVDYADLVNETCKRHIFRDFGSDPLARYGNSSERDHFLITDDKPTCKVFGPVIKAPSMTSGTISGVTPSRIP